MFSYINEVWRFSNKIAVLISRVSHTANQVEKVYPFYLLTLGVSKRRLGEWITEYIRSISPKLFARCLGDEAVFIFDNFPEKINAEYLNTYVLERGLWEAVWMRKYPVARQLVSRQVLYDEIRNIAEKSYISDLPKIVSIFGLDADFFLRDDYAILKNLSKSQLSWIVSELFHEGIPEEITNNAIDSELEESTSEYESTDGDFSDDVEYWYHIE